MIKRNIAKIFLGFGLMLLAIATKLDYELVKQTSIYARKLKDEINNK